LIILTLFQTFLPNFNCSENSALRLKTVEQLLDGENFKFGNPIESFKEKLWAGKFSTDSIRMSAILMKSKKTQYRFVKLFFITFNKLEQFNFDFQLFFNDLTFYLKSSVTRTKLRHFDKCAAIPKKDSWIHHKRPSENPTFSFENEKKILQSRLFWNLVSNILCTFISFLDISSSQWKNSKEVFSRFEWNKTGKWKYGKLEFRRRKLSW